jgi:hypothetical protein
VIERQWTSPVTRCVRRSIRLNIPSTRVDAILAVDDRLAHPIGALCDEHWDEIFLARKDEDVGLVGVRVLRNPFVGAPCNARDGGRPADAEGALRMTGTIIERELRLDAATRGDG